MSTRTEAFVREQIGLCTAYYMQVRPASREASETAKHMGKLRSELAALIWRRRATKGTQAKPAEGGE